MLSKADQTLGSQIVFDDSNVIGFGGSDSGQLDTNGVVTELPIRMDPNASTVVVSCLTGLSRQKMVSEEDAISVAYHREQTAVQVQYKAPADACASENISLAALVDGCVVDDVDIQVGHRVLLEKHPEGCLWSAPPYTTYMHSSIHRTMAVRMASMWFRPMGTLPYDHRTCLLAPMLLASSFTYFPTPNL